MAVLAEQEGLRKRVQWMMIIRLVVISVTLAIGSWLFELPLSRFYHYIYFYYIASLLYIIYLQRSREVAFLGVLQILVDLLAVTSILVIADPIDTMYGSLYSVVIVFSSLVFPRWGGMITAVTAIVLYAMCVLHSYRSAPITFRAASDYALFVTYMHTVIFLGMGYLSNYVSRLLLKKTEELSQLEEQSNYVFRHVRTGILMVDEGGLIRYANPAAGQMLGCGPKDLLGLHWHGVLGIDRVDSVQARKELEAGREVEVMASRRDGSEVPLGITASPVAYPSGRSRYSIVLCRDLHEQREHERRLRDATRLSGIVELSATIAHEIRNPLTSVSGSAELLLEQLHDERLQGLARTIIREVERLDAIVEDFLTFTRLRTMELTQCDLNELLTDVAVLLYHNRRFKPTMKIIYRELPEPVPVVVDVRQFKQALLNLGLNALDAMPNGGELEITAEPYESRVVITVRDSGVGIPPEVLPHIFEPFFSTKEEGTGIGLYVTQRIVESHRGTITCRSEVGKGTTFRLEIPRRMEV
ncbi:MAG: ATP-binding protein [bacterium]|nr:ATP-binding protein [bacterium]